MRSLLLECWCALYGLQWKVIYILVPLFIINHYLKRGRNEKVVAVVRAFIKRMLGRDR